MPSLVNINTLSPSLRDFLIGLSLHPITSTVTNNNLTNLLGNAGGYTGIGLPFTVNYASSVTPIPYAESLKGTADVVRPFTYALNQFQGSVTATQNDYEDVGEVIGAPLNINNLPNSAGTATYGLSILTSTPPNIYSPNPVPDNPYTPNLNNQTPYVYNIGKNTFFKSPSTSNYSSTYYQFNPGFPAIFNTVNTENKLVSPNFNLNLYKGSDKEITYAGDALYGNMGVQNQKEGYLDANGKLNIGGPSTEPYNTISSLLSGGVGFNKNGGGLSVVNNNDIRNTIVGRALTATGLINDTNLGIIGAERLAISLANNAAFKLQKETIGRVNLDVFSWIDGKKDDFIVPNYEITVPAGLLGKTVDFLGDLAGFTRPKSQMKTEFFSFDERFTPTGIGNIARANGMLETTGKGQVIALFRNMQANLLNSNFTKQGYAPGIVNKRLDGDDAFLHNVYAYGNDDGEIIEDVIYNSPNGVGNGNSRWTSTDGSGFEGDYFGYKTDGNGGNYGTATESDFVWSDTTINIDENNGNTLISDAETIFGVSPTEGETNSLYQPNRKSILYKTKELFKYGSVATLVNGHLTMTERSQIQSSVLSNGMMSKGNAALTSTYLQSGPGGLARNLVYCRTWTPMDKYDEISDLIRHKSLNTDGGNYRRNSHLSPFSILENTGFVKIARYATDTETIRRHMFSIENLAWKDFPWADAESGVKDMPFCEKGPYGGRIMWFPPYDIKFSENTSVNWDKHNFIGRGEPMYTYNNTERTGQLSFKVIIDNPNELNYRDKNNIFKSTEYGDEDDHYASYFAGCNFNDILTPEEIKTIIPPPPSIPPIPITPPTSPLPPTFRVFFPNDNHTYPNDYPEYESGVINAASIGNINKIEHKGKVTYTVVKSTGYKLYSGTETPNIDRYIAVEPDPNNNGKYIDYNLLMGKKDGAPMTDPKEAGPANPTNMSYTDYENYRIDWKANPSGYKYFGLGLIYIKNPRIVGCVTQYYVDRYNFGLNANRWDAENYNLTLPGNATYGGCRWAGWLAASDMDGKSECQVSYLTALKNHMDYNNGPCKDCIIKIDGYASTQCVDCENPLLPGKSCAQRNLILSDKRAESVAEYLRKNVLDPSDPNKDKRIKATLGKGETTAFNQFVPDDQKCNDDSPTDLLGCKMNRRVNVTFEHDPSLSTKSSTQTATPQATVQQPTVTPTVATVAKDKIRSYYQECDYFAKLLEKDPFTFKKLSDKVKFFSPAFHSTTPEGFNSRLTFLQQCTRQGPSVYGQENKPDNLVFGRPPVCILRIGDFYYTKIIIESLSIDYEPLVWDLNPEGVGVQPMIANVSMNFAFIGGSSLDGPISKLQNGLSFNYYANTGLFVGNMADNNSATMDTTTLTATDVETTNVYENQDQQTTIPPSASAMTAQGNDIEILNAGVLSLTYDDSGIFQGKVKGKFTIKSKLSKEYTIKLRTLPSNTKPDNKLGEEPIDVQKLKLNELSVEFTSKSKTTNSLQKWDFYFTDTYANSTVNVNSSVRPIYRIVQEDLNEYVKNKTVNENDMIGNEDNGWDYVKSVTKSDFESNYTFVVEVEALKFSKKYTARWVPKFKTDRHRSIAGTKEVENDDGTINTFNTFNYKWETYLSGGKLDIVKNSDIVAKDGTKTSGYLTPDQEAEIKKAKAKQDKKDAKKQNKDKKDKEKEDKKAKKQAIDEQKAKVKAGGGSLS